MDKVLYLLMEFAAGNLKSRQEPSGYDDEMDQIIQGLNLLREKLLDSAVSLDFLKNILKAMVDGLIITDTNLIVLEVNPTLESLLGYKAKELVGKSIDKIYCGESALFDSLARGVAEKGYFIGVETTCISRTNIKIPVSVSISAIGDPRVQIRNFIFINHDISTLKERETELLAANRKMLSIIDTLPDLLLELDQNGFIYYCHIPQTGLPEISSIDFLNKYIIDVIPSAAANSIMSSVKEAVEKGWSNAAGFEWQLPHGNAWFEVCTNRMKDEPGREPHFVVMARDITSRKKAETELNRKMNLFSQAQKLSCLGSWQLDIAENKLTWSEETFRIFEKNPETFIPSYESCMEIVHPQDAMKVSYAHENSLLDGKPYEIIHRVVLSNEGAGEQAKERVKWVRRHGSCFFDENKNPVLIIGTFQDITCQKQTEEALRIAALTFETNEGVLITDENANILHVNRAFQEITGFSPEEVIGKNPGIMSSGKHGKSFFREMWRQINLTGSWSGEIWDIRKNGQCYPQRLTISAVKNTDNDTRQYVGIFSDISDRKKAEEEVKKLAFYDSLTNIPNRRLLLDRFRLAISLSARSRKYGAVLYLDIDKFKNLNDIMGHEYGDILLIEVARRIQAGLREGDTVARQGGDEFVILIEEICEDQEQALKKVALIAEKLKTALTVPYQLGEYAYYSSVSIGICLYRGHEKTMLDLLKSADMAMYQAKYSGRNAIRFFDPLMQKTVETHAALESNLRIATLSNQQLRLHYQVQVDSNFKALGAEALVRWKDPKLGYIPPAKFIQIAEESNLILDIGNWVIESACRQLGKWKDHEQLNRLTLSVNVSARQFGLSNFVERIKEVISTYQIDPSRLKLELTEHVLLADITNVVNKMRALKDLGVWLCIDDFGTGYSSLSYLKQLPISQLKIDQSFVRDLATDPNDAMMVKTIISLARNFRLDVIAEGVETEAQVDFLKRHDCLSYQGFLFGKALPIERFEKQVKLFQ